VAAGVGDEPLEQGEHEPCRAGDAGGEWWERVRARSLNGGQVLLERLAEAVDRHPLPAGAELVPVDLGEDAVAARVGEHLQEHPQ
jgi:hypothetical protein